VDNCVSLEEGSQVDLEEGKDLALREKKMIDLEDPKWDSRLLGKIVHNVV
jgi:hypothetical protein